jgi:hypothetical protein
MSLYKLCIYMNMCMYIMIYVYVYINDHHYCILQVYQDKEVKAPYMSFCGFLYHYSWHLIGCCLCYSVVNFIFFGQLLQVNEVLKYVGYNKQQDYQSTLDESRGFVKGFVLVVLVPLIPGYYFTAFTIDMLGHRSLQWFGFVLTAGFLGACSGKIKICIICIFLVLLCFVMLVLLVIYLFAVLSSFCTYAVLAGPLGDRFCNPHFVIFLLSKHHHHHHHQVLTTFY